MISIYKITKKSGVIVSIVAALVMTGCGSEKAEPVESPAPVAESKIEQAKQPPLEEISEQKRHAEEKRAAELERKRQLEEEKLAGMPTPEEFDERLLELLGVESMGEVERRGDALIYQLDMTGEMTLNEVVTQSKLKTVNIYVNEVRGDTVAAALVFYNAAIKAYSPAVDSNAIFGALSLDATIVENITKPQTFTLSEVTYTKKLIGKKLLLGISAQ